MTDGLSTDVREGRPSASGFERLVLCPGSWLAEQACRVDGEPESEAAAMGTRLHAHMEHGTLPEDPVEAEAVQWCRDTEVMLKGRYLGSGEIEFLREYRWWAADHRFSGQADAVFFSGSKMLVLDYKFGRHAVASAAANYQLYALAALAFELYPGVEEVYAGILQPFVSRSEPRVLLLTRADEAGLRQFVVGALDAAEAPGAKLVPGEAQCRYCRAAASCPALSHDVAALAPLERWELWSPDQRRRAWDAAKLAKKYVEAIERKVRADLEAGVEIPGLVLGDGKASFAVQDAQAAFSILSGELGVSAEEFTGCCKVGITPLDKLVHAKLKEREPKQTTKASREWLRETLAACGETKYSAGTIKEVQA